MMHHTAKGLTGRQAIKARSGPRGMDVHDVYGVRDTVRTRRAAAVGLAHALDQRADTVIGRLRLLKVISEEQYRAGVQMEALVQLFRMAKGLGVDRVQAIDMRGVTGGGGTAFDDEMVLGLQHRYERMFRALKKAGEDAHRATVASVSRGETATDETIFPLRTGLSALAKHFGFGRGAPNRILVWAPDGKCRVDISVWGKP